MSRTLRLAEGFQPIIDHTLADPVQTMSDRIKPAIDFKIYDFRNFSAREAFWIALLLHLIVLFLPQRYNPFLLFVNEQEIVQAQPITFNFSQQQDPLMQPDKVAAEEAMEAKTIENQDETLLNKDPSVAGETNLKRLETPPQQPLRTPATPRERPSDVGLRRAELLENQTIDPQLKAEHQKQVNERLEAALQKPMFKPSDFPIIYDNRKPSRADLADSVIQFDTYAWNYEPYRDRMLNKLYRFWVPKLQLISYFMLNIPGRTVIRFTILTSGKVVRVELLGQSGKEPYDLAANHSITYPFPGLVTAFPPLPPDFPKESLTVTVGFYVNTHIPERSSSGNNK